MGTKKDENNIIVKHRRNRHKIFFYNCAVNCHNFRQRMTIEAITDF